MPKKNILVFADGTGQEGGRKSDTNVYKLFKMVENRTDRQIAFYDRGLGTGSRKITSSISGFGISENIIECYQFIFENFKAGDDIYLFGFSRGATTVRSLAGFIHMFGMLPKSRPELIAKAYRIYKIPNVEKRQKRADEFVKKYHNMWCRIKFLGVWDTVAALGLPIKSVDWVLNKIPYFRHSFHSLDLSASVEHARHALAIDDERKVFHPTVWNKDVCHYQTMKQVWFCGMHTDVGGGYDEQEVSDIPLVWMVKEAQQYGLIIYPRNKVPINQQANGIMHDSRGTFFTKFYSRKIRTWDAEKLGKPVLHESVILRHLNPKNLKDPAYDPWIKKLEYDIEPWPEELRTIDKLA